MLNLINVFKEYGIDLEEALSASKSTPAMDVVNTPLSWRPAMGVSNMPISWKEALENL